MNAKLPTRQGRSGSWTSWYELCEPAIRRISQTKMCRCPLTVSVCVCTCWQTRWLQVAFEDIKAFSLDLAELLRANEAATASVWGDATDSPGGGGAAPAVDGDVFA